MDQTKAELITDSVSPEKFGVMLHPLFHKSRDYLNRMPKELFCGQRASYLLSVTGFGADLIRCLPFHKAINRGISMSRFNRFVSVLLLTLLPVLGFAQNISDEEEHVLRGFFDRQSAAATYNQLAITRASTPDLQSFAKSEIVMYQTLSTDVAKLYRAFYLSAQPVSAENKSPTLKQGVTRGVKTLPAGYTWAADTVASFISTGEALQGMPAASRYSELDDLKALSGAAFDKQYMLRVLLAHNAMMKHIVTQLSLANANPDMKAFAEKALVTVQNQSNLAQRLYENNGSLPQQRQQPVKQ